MENAHQGSAWSHTHLATTSVELSALLRAQKNHHQKLGQFLLEEKLVTSDNLRIALSLQKVSPSKKLGEILIEMNSIAKEEVERSVLETLDLPRVALDEFDFDTKITSLLPVELARDLHVIPLMFLDDVLILATAYLLTTQSLELLRFTVEHSVQFVLSSHDEIDRAIKTNYQAFQTVQELDIPAQEQIDEQRIWRDAEQLAKQAPLVQLVNSIILEAINQRASDIHIRPSEKTFELLYRVDGSLLSIRQFKNSLLPAVVSRIKILSSLNIAEHRLAQDGRIRIKDQSQSVDLRVSIIPVQYGESIVIRILNKNQGLRSVDEIGFKPNDKERFLDLIKRSYGIILVTGPTGSGKSTTLYAALQEVEKDNVNVITVEDPIEYELSNTRQIQVNQAINFGFAQALRHILRHDPDVIMVGEMRDAETCKIAVESALTGHLVFSTLHTNDASSALVRLMEIGIAPYLIRSAVIGVLAQRLVRRNCPDCLEEEEVSLLMRKNLALDQNEKFYRGSGCKNCRHTGFKGRLAIYELLVMNDELRAQINAGVASDDYRQLALKNGMVSLPVNGVEQARTRQVSIAEVYRACM
ncbi:MAG: ATPase, T2SS/T4P/T4SS family [Undibacterium sp.]|uniref:GspE/PulE family protein n=1 Tax=Undibacterium sp. TaxID=1914977 RepID=UPI0027282FA0|nr:type II/IV secretion system protein [Undibacterium sp.]MDO8651981.1 ATPase, T2SS/T4P/T4SS family [Undibacterium sp.]